MSFVVFLAAGLAAEPAPPPPDPVIHAPVTHEAALDAEYAAHDYTALTRLLFEPTSSEQAVAGLDWLGAKWRGDGTVYIAEAYSALLQMFADAQPGDSGDQLRATALAALAHAALAARSDSQQCGDGTARATKLESLLPLLGESGLLALDEETRRKAAWIALVNEAVTWERRQMLDQAPHLCRGGMMAMIAGLAQGATAEREPGEGEFGRQIAVSPPTDFVFERLQNAAWVPAAEQARESNEDMLETMLSIETIPTNAQMRFALEGE